ncbi:hypothetical protein K7432_008077 [Basidiobolus ranarum]|uniref:Yeast cell wall synthesis Kre9/Knh1-like N-terminal domain-containing protein n=1 Tax=Basidiobolus ranarum TaxID=34480 RepID=A0ABR2VZ68_9FUNG
MKGTAGLLLYTFLLSQSCLSSLVQPSDTKSTPRVESLPDASGSLSSMRPEIQKRPTPPTPRVSIVRDNTENPPAPRIVETGTVPPPDQPTLTPSQPLHPPPRILSSKHRPMFFNDSPYDFTIVNPTDGTQWEIGTKVVIRWELLRTLGSPQSDRKVRLQLLLKEKVISNLTDSVDTHDNQFIWLVPTNLRTNKNYYLRIGTRQHDYSYSRIFEIRGLPFVEGELSEPETLDEPSVNMKSLGDNKPSKSSPPGNNNLISFSVRISPGGIPTLLILLLMPLYQNHFIAIVPLIFLIPLILD